MVLREKFGKLVLLEEMDAGHLGVVYRAARLDPSGLEGIVTLLRYSEAVSNHSEARERLMEQARGAARLQIPGLMRALNIGRVEQSYYASYGLVEGRTLQAVIDRARAEAFPFSPENALMVASRAAAVLEALHARKDDAGAALFHGLVQPSHLVVSWEGETRVAGAGTWPALRDTDLLGPDERLWLAPEQVAGDAGDPRSDVHALALVLLAALTGWSPDGSEPLVALATARLPGVAGDEELLPEPLEKLLSRALAPDPESRYPGMGEMRQAIDALLFSGDFTPTTFNLAFFMQTLFREDMERETKALEEARRADYTEFLPPPPDPAAEPEPPPEEPPPDPAPESPPPEAPPGGAPRGPEASGPTRSARRPRPGARRPGSLPPSGSGRLFAGSAKPAGRHRGLALVVGLVLAVAAGGGGSYLYFARIRPLATRPPATTLSPDTAAALARVQELEARLAELEREKAELQAAAAGAGRAASEAPPAETPADPAPPPAPTEDPGAAAVDRAEARRQARAERARREEQIRLLEEEINAAQGRLVAEQGSAAGPVDFDAALPPPTAPLPTPAAAPPAPPLVVRGQRVEAGDPEVTGPELLDEGPRVLYPAAARNLGRSALVVVEALVGEDGRVLEARAVESSVAGMGFEAAAERKVRGQRYRPATKGGVPVRVPVRVSVRFTP